MLAQFADLLRFAIGGQEAFTVETRNRRADLFGRLPTQLVNGDGPPLLTKSNRTCQGGPWQSMKILGYRPGKVLASLK